jgi:hypothetical protein
MTFLFNVLRADNRNVPALGRIGDPDDILASVRVEDGKVILEYSIWLPAILTTLSIDTSGNVPGDAIIPVLHRRWLAPTLAGPSTQAQSSTPGARPFGKDGNGITLAIEKSRLVGDACRHL